MSFPDESAFIGRVFSGYRIEEFLGQGGMGVVYRALDLRLARPAVLKFVARNPFPSEDARSQLVFEAQAAASLNHPNICTIYGVGEEHNHFFIAMEFLEGTDVRRLIYAGALPLPQALSIVRQAGRGLQEAHKKGLIHRDIKSSNIFLTRGGTVKLLDFGLAARVCDPDETRAFQRSGTLNYMAPEQLELGMADARSDIWSLAVVFYEMLTGRQPFGGPGRPSLKPILLENPSPPSLLVPSLPVDLDHVLAKALEKNPKDRYQSVAELLAGLEQIANPTQAGVTPHPAARSSIHFPIPKPEGRVIAVLPFANLSSDPNDEYICDGLAEELIDGLTQIQSLRVVSRSSSFQFKGVNPDIRDVSRKLRATHVVHGSLRRSGDRLRLIAQLSETREGYQLWSQRFDSTMKDLFSLQDELSEAVLLKLRPRLKGPGDKAAGRNPQAHDLYLRARYLFNTQAAKGLRQAVQFLKQAIQLEPEGAAAYIALAECHATLEWYGLEPSLDAVPALKSALQDGLRINPDSIPGLCLLATVQAGYDWDWAAAERTFQSALTLGPGFASVLFHYALDFLTPLGRLEEALEITRGALELDPVSAITNTALGGCYYRLGRWNEAAASLRNTLELIPAFGHAHWSLGRALLELGEGVEAIHHFDEALRVMGPTATALAEKGYALGRLDQPVEARQILSQLETIANREFVSPLNFALVTAGLSDCAATLSYLQQALEQRTRQLTWINVDPRFGILQKYKEFQNLLLHLGLAS